MITVTSPCHNKVHLTSTLSVISPNCRHVPLHRVNCLSPWLPIQLLCCFVYNFSNRDHTPHSNRDSYIMPSHSNRDSYIMPSHSNRDSYVMPSHSNRDQHNAGVCQTSHCSYCTGHSYSLVIVTPNHNHFQREQNCSLMSAVYVFCVCSFI